MSRAVRYRPDPDPEQGVRSRAVLTERLASAIVEHDPGWRLPLPSALARRYNVSTAEIEGAIEDLVAGHVVRRMADGRMYRMSPADYRIALEGLPGIGSYIDPMGAAITCSHRNVSWRQVPEDISLALGLEPPASCTICRCQWTANGQRAAVSTTYLPDASRNLVREVDPGRMSAGEDIGWPPAVAAALDGGSPAIAAAVQVEVRPPARSAARSLELRPGALAITVAVRFVDPVRRVPVALTLAALRADLFRITIESAGADMPAPDISAPGDGFYAEGTAR